MRAASVLVVALAWPATAFGQDTPALRPKHVSVSAGAVTTGGYPIGDMTANLRRNTTTTPATPFPLLRAESDIERVTGVEARVGVALTRSLEVEVSGSYAAPQLAVTISQDDEVSESVAVGERLQQYVIGVSGVYLLPRLSVGSRVRPYVVGGAGYLRQLHEGRLRADEGRTLHAGGGIRYWLRGGGATSRSLGARAEVRVVRRTGGIEFADQARTFPVASLLAFIGF